MIKEPHPSETRGEQELAGLVGEVTNKLQAGEAVDIEWYLSTYPQHAEELRQLFPAIQALAGLGTPDLATPAGSPLTASALSGRGTLGDFRIVREIGRGGMGIV